MPFNVAGISHQEKYCHELVSDTVTSSPGFAGLARVSLKAPFPLLVILFHTAQGVGQPSKLH